MLSQLYHISSNVVIKQLLFQSYFPNETSSNATQQILTAINQHYAFYLGSCMKKTTFITTQIEHRTVTLIFTNICSTAYKLASQKKNLIAKLITKIKYTPTCLQLYEFYQLNNLFGHNSQKDTIVSNSRRFILKWHCVRENRSATGVMAGTSSLPEILKRSVIDIRSNENISTCYSSCNIFQVQGLLMIS